MIAVTGATGFLGSALVRRLQASGAGPIRGLARPGTTPRRDAGPGAGTVDEWCAWRPDDPAGLVEALSGVSVLYHLAAPKVGPAAALVAGAVSASDALFRGALEMGVGRVVLVSSFSVLGTGALPRGAVVDEDAPLEPAPERRDAYAFAKQRQERLAWRWAERGLPLAVVRPGWIFGPGQPLLGTRVGLSVFGLFLHLGGDCPLPLTYVENCADAVALAGEAPDAAGRAFHVVDDDLPTSRALLARYRREVGGLRVVPVPRPALALLSRANAWYSARTRGHVPAVLTPYKVAATWRPLRYSNARAKALLGWAPRVGMDEALSRTLGAIAAAEAERCAS